MEEACAALAMLGDLWAFFTDVVDADLDYGKRFLRQFRACGRCSNFVVQVQALSLMFRLLQEFTEMKSPYAPLMYATKEQSCHFPASLHVCDSYVPHHRFALDSGTRR